MERVIEQYLMEKFRKGLETRESNNTSKIPLLTKFQQIKSSLHKILNSPQPLDQIDPSSIRENLYYLNDLLSECQILAKKNRSFNSLLEINNIRIKLNKIKAELDSAGEGQVTVNPPQQPNGGEITPRGSITTTNTTTSRLVDDSSTIHGFDERLESLETLILRRGGSDGDDRFKAIAIVGAEGVGKTTLCQMVLNKESVKNRFSPRVWVSIYEDPKRKEKDPKINIAKRILASLGVKNETIELVLEKNGLGGLLCAIHLELLGKRYLIVFDDVREKNQWYGQLSEKKMGKWEECLGYGLPKGYGGTVIVTSRNEGVAKQMVGDDERSLFTLLPLSDVDICWKIFEHLVEKDFPSFNPLNEEDLKKEVMEKCGGIPLGAKMLGEAMYEQLQDVHRSPLPQRHP